MVVKFSRFCRISNRRCVLVYIFFLLFCLSFLWFFVHQTIPVEYHHVRFGEHHECTSHKFIPKVAGQKRLILFYTTIFDRVTVFYPNELQCCEPFNCEITTDKSRLLESDAVVFHGRDLPLGVKMPKQRTAKQRWVFYSMENPFYSKIVTSDYNGMFNWTMTYERRSDVYEPYGYYTKIIQSTPIKKDVKPRNYAEGKDKLLVFVNGNCQTVDGAREKFVRALSKIVKVDVHGKCGGIFGRLTCPRNERCQKLLRRFKFYISIENGVCEDYVTEKYWNVPFKIDAVPIVFGFKFFKELSIPGSFIDATAFPNLQSLVSYLQYLDKNDTAYNEYFEWRNKYQTANLEPWPCRLCRMLHNNSLPIKTIKLDQFLNPDLVCRKLKREDIHIKF
ncbi:alpha-(1,3)-fucosyltransferase fut-1-like [Dendronephthya gigantea]|uniref:alpha-(1,3)-fucosyltransferase fut-1-like n=1 Tax=Dendronephthya gigantea TaxID=151771 RepID=UPI00106C35AB|nr:alpha-(1,3)-fucosyltransferase fut-1-like [Dendronephthya gigantea]